MCRRKLTLGKKRDIFFNQNDNFLINNRVSWTLLRTSNPGACWPCFGPSSAEIYVCAAGFAESASSPETRQPFSLQ